MTMHYNDVLSLCALHHAQISITQIKAVYKNSKHLIWISRLVTLFIDICNITKKAVV